jgi:argininosuccinate lyase
LATDLADYLVRKGMAFRAAHHVVGTVVALSEKLGRPLNQLTLEELHSVDPIFGADARDVFNLDAAMKLRELPGAPGPRQIAKQLARWKKALRGRR